MSNGKKKVTVRIMDKDYTFRSSDDPEYLRTIAEYVDRKMRGIARGSVNFPIADAAILAAVNIADELHKARRRVAAAQGSNPAGEGAPGPAADAADWDQVGEKIQMILDALPK